MAGSPPAIIRETRRGQAVFMAAAPQEPPGGSQSVRSSCEAGNDRGAKGRRKVEVRRTERRKRKPTRVPARANRWWNPPSANGSGDTERLTDGLGDEAKSRSPSTEHPPTGKPDAGDPPVRFGGRGGAHRAIPTPICRAAAQVELVALRRVAPRSAAQRTREKLQSLQAPAPGRPLNAGGVVAARQLLRAPEKAGRQSGESPLLCGEEP